MNLVKAIVFDFFGVIQVDPFLRWLNKYGYSRSGDFWEVSQLTDRGVMSEKEFYVRLSALSGQTVDSVTQDFNSSSPIDSSLIKLIDELHKQYETGILTNASTEYIRPILQKHDLSELFDEIIISSEIGMVKPSPKIFEYTTDKFGVQPDQVIFIDDNTDNISAAISTGMKGITYSEDLLKLKKDLSNYGVIN